MIGIRALAAAVGSPPDVKALLMELLSWVGLSRVEAGVTVICTPGAVCTAAGMPSVERICTSDVGSEETTIGVVSDGLEVSLPGCSSPSCPPRSAGRVGGFFGTDVGRE